MKKNRFQEIIEILVEIETDETVPKSMRSKVREAINFLESQPSEIAVDKLIQELDSLLDDPNLPVYARTQIWNAVSLLESQL